jgi:hypothetical protein
LAERRLFSAVTAALEAARKAEDGAGATGGADSAGGEGEGEGAATSTVAGEAGAASFTSSVVFGCRRRSNGDTGAVLRRLSPGPRTEHSTRPVTT